MTKYRCEAITDPKTGRAYVNVYYPENSTQVFRSSPPNFANVAEAEAAMPAIAQATLPDFTKLQADPDNKGWVLGHGVIKKTPWHFGGIYPTKMDADHIAGRLGDGYEVAYGSHRIDSDDFVSK